jgi:hypothetical protein
LWVKRAAPARAASVILALLPPYMAYATARAAAGGSLWVVRGVWRRGLLRLVV